MFEVLDSARKVAEESRHVMIDKKALTRFCRQLPVFGMEVPPWENSYHFYDGAEKTVSYLLVLDSLNFCFWPAHGEKKWEIEYDSEKLSGYYALAASLKNAVERGIPITNAVYLAELSLKDLKRILSGSGRLQLLEKRVKILNELGRVLVEDFHGKAESLVGAASHSAGRLARLLADKLISFQDVAKYKGKKVFFYKRAQIFAADLHATFKGKDWGRFKDMGGLTAFA
ncbi:MAG: queuosine salvage family protein, partial [Thermodesulfobacteriota bacterium]|nr:queuosine salvage family protein [Thermodesulfobacteriota bacterium]